MNDFVYYSPTRIFFGKGKAESIGKEILKYGDKVLLLYGKGSILKNGVYDDVVSSLSHFKIPFIELSGVRANPGIESVREGVHLCREHKLNFILAVGGGSVIDCAKAIAAGFYYEGDPWDFFISRAKVNEALPIGSVLTLAATGSEMNAGTVISNDATEEKLACIHEKMRPRFSILDPCYTFSVDPYQTAAGVADIISHCLEQYFTPVADTFLQDRLTEAILQVCIHYGPIALAEPDNYDARANLMWGSSLALTGILATGKEGDWATHYIEHKISAVSGLTHGIGLAILTPAWMEEVLDEERIDKFLCLAANLWSLPRDDDKFVTAKLCIQKFSQFFSEMGIASSLKVMDIHLSDEKLEQMANDLTINGKIGRYKLLGKDEILRILKKIK